MALELEHIEYLEERVVECFVLSNLATIEGNLELMARHVYEMQLCVHTIVSEAPRRPVDYDAVLNRMITKAEAEIKLYDGIDSARLKAAQFRRKICLLCRLGDPVGLNQLVKIVASKPLPTPPST